MAFDSAIILFIIGIGFIFSSLAFSLREDHWILSIILILATFVTLLLGSNIVINMGDMGMGDFDVSLNTTAASEAMQSSLDNLYFFVIIVFVMIIMYIITYILLVSLNFMQSKKEEDFE